VIVNDSRAVATYQTALQEALDLEPAPRKAASLRIVAEQDAEDGRYLKELVEAAAGNRLEEWERLWQVTVRTTLSRREPLPESIKNFRLVRRIGTGGMGEVYEVEQVAPVQRTVALKLIRGDLSHDRAITRFEAEQQAQASLEHSGIARNYEAGGGEDGRFFFAMEYVKGAAITKVCDAYRLPVDERLKLFLNVCDGRRVSAKHIRAFDCRAEG
jgi:serine/threonine protein kinase